MLSESEQQKSSLSYLPTCCYIHGCLQLLRHLYWLPIDSLSLRREVVRVDHRGGCGTGLVLQLLDACCNVNNDPVIITNKLISMITVTKRSVWDLQVMKNNSTSAFICRLRFSCGIWVFAVPASIGSFMESLASVTPNARDEKSCRQLTLNHR